MTYALVRRPQPLQAIEGKQGSPTSPTRCTKNKKRENWRIPGLVIISFGRWRKGGKGDRGGGGWMRKLHYTQRRGEEEGKDRRRKLSWQPATIIIFPPSQSLSARTYVGACDHTFNVPRFLVGGGDRTRGPHSRRGAQISLPTTYDSAVDPIRSSKSRSSTHRFSRWRGCPVNL